jgi:hypothetical protein
MIRAGARHAVSRPPQDNFDSAPNPDAIAQTHVDVLRQD